MSLKAEELNCINTHKIPTFAITDIIEKMKIASAMSREETEFVNSILTDADVGTNAWTWKLSNDNNITNTGGSVTNKNQFRWFRLQDSNSKVKKFTKQKEGDPKVVLGKAVAIVHASAEQVLAFFWQTCGNLRMKVHQKEEGNLLRRNYIPKENSTKKLPSSPEFRQQGHTQHAVIHKSTPSPFQTVINMKNVWCGIKHSSKAHELEKHGRQNIQIDDNNDNSGFQSCYVLCFKPARTVEFGEEEEEEEERKEKFNIIKATTTMFRLRVSQKEKQRIAPLTSAEAAPADEADTDRVSKNGGRMVQLKTKGVYVIRVLALNLCEVTLVNSIADSFHNSFASLNTQIKGALNEINVVRHLYERSGELVDRELRHAFVMNVPQIASGASKEQHQLVENQMNKFKNAQDDFGWERMEKDSTVFVKLFKKNQEGEKSSWGKAKTIVDASAEEVLAWLWDYCGHERLNASQDLDKKSREKIESVAPNQAIFSTIEQMPWPMNARRFVFENIWTKNKVHSRYGQIIWLLNKLF